MSAASPRPSLNLPSSRRTSTSTITSTRSPSSSRPASVLGSTANSTPVPSTTRRNRAALREFYNLQSQPAAPTINEPASANHEDANNPLSALDNPGFDADKYVSDLLNTSDAQTLLKTLNMITVSSLGLEGDKKALVYDNYTTLLSATSTISRMRQNVDPMAPVTTTLEPAVKHIADTAQAIKDKRSGVQGSDDGARTKEKQKETVRWVLGAPERLKTLRESQEEDEAKNLWAEVRAILEKWGDGVGGVKELREKCENVMKEEIAA